MAMNSIADFYRVQPFPSPLCAWSCLVADRVNPLLPQILAFWALWHCRHARPPDSLTA
ncbi:conserved protein of unknown function [Pseudomonas marincola]|uniref:Uncharacterized protein n=1 Tax=Pseudomonas marincola TaxID=437900 RepID=A0A653E2E3_9PSED|nr:conserved protein of unknown function [Pseudomonas marincola]